MDYATQGSRTVTVTQLREMKAAGERIAALTAYDASFAALEERCGVEVLLVGDSLGMVVKGERDTLGVSVADILYHCRAVRRGAGAALLMADMPFASYASPAQALGNAARLLAEGGANMVKLEGGGWLAGTVRLLDERGIPVCAHLGLQPQQVHKLGGYRIQGRDREAARQILEDALTLQRAGAGALVLECVPAALAAEITAALDIPTIGIGAGAGCDGQVLVLHDALGVSASQPRFCRDFLQGRQSVEQALRAYVQAVKQGTFPSTEHSVD